MELADRLGAMGYDVCGHALRGDVALEAIPELRPDVVILDVTLLGPLNGIEVAARLRASCDVPVIFLTDAADAATTHAAEGLQSAWRRRR